MGVVSVALGDLLDSDKVVWSIVFKSGLKRVGRIKPMGDSIYAIEDLRTWYFHTSQVSMIAAEIIPKPA